MEPSSKEAPQCQVSLGLWQLSALAMAWMSQTMHCCFQLSCNTRRDFEVILQHYFYGSFVAADRLSIVGIEGEEDAL